MVVPLISSLMWACWIMETDVKFHPWGLSFRVFIAPAASSCFSSHLWGLPFSPCSLLVLVSRLFVDIHSEPDVNFPADEPCRGSFHLKEPESNLYPMSRSSRKWASFWILFRSPTPGHFWRAHVIDNPSRHKHRSSSCYYREWPQDGSTFLARLVPPAESLKESCSWPVK